MKASPTSLNLRDFTQRHQGTFGWYIKQDGSRLLVHIDKVDRIVNFSDVDGFKFYAAVDKHVEFEFLPITRGWFNTSTNKPVFLHRVPARQYTRGISTSNTQCLSFSNSGLLLKSTLSMEMLNDIFVVKPQQTFEQFLSSGLFFVINKYFLINKTTSDVWLYDRVIGKWDGKRTITLSSSMFYQELFDAISRNKLPLEVVNDNVV
jgi:hypothetical protein